MLSFAQDLSATALRRSPPHHCPLRLEQLNVLPPPFNSDSAEDVKQNLLLNMQNQLEEKKHIQNASSIAWKFSCGSSSSKNSAFAVSFADMAATSSFLGFGARFVLLLLLGTCCAQTSRMSVGWPLFRSKICCPLKLFSSKLAKILARHTLSILI